MLHSVMLPLHSVMLSYGIDPLQLIHGIASPAVNSARLYLYLYNLLLETAQYKVLKERKKLTWLVPPTKIPNILNEIFLLNQILSLKDLKYILLANDKTLTTCS